jgi:uncharacterized protein (TIGR00725 family)
VRDVPGLANRTVGVIGSGTDEHDETARPLGELLADLGVNLLTGGGGGVMRAVSRAFTSRPRATGICIGILPCASETDRSTAPRGYPNEFVELAIRTHLPYSGRQGTHDLSRNHINILSCDAIVALPGEFGTVSEVILALQYRKPIGVFATESATVAHFPESAPRFAALPDLDAFLRRHLARA